MTREIIYARKDIKGFILSTYRKIQYSVKR